MLQSDRASGRELARLEASANLEVANAHAVEAIEIAKIEALGSITKVGLANVAEIATVALAHAEQNPYAFQELHRMGRTAALEFEERIRRANRRLG